MEKPPKLPTLPKVTKYKKDTSHSSSHNSSNQNSSNSNSNLRISFEKNVKNEAFNLDDVNFSVIKEKAPIEESDMFDVRKIDQQITNSLRSNQKQTITQRHHPINQF